MYRTTRHQRRRNTEKNPAVWTRRSTVTHRTGVIAALRILCGKGRLHFPGPYWRRPSSRSRVTWVHQICSDTRPFGTGRLSIGTRSSFMASCRHGLRAMRAMRTMVMMMIVVYRFVHRSLMNTTDNMQK